MIKEIISLIIFFWIFIGLIPFIMFICYIPKKNFIYVKKSFKTILFNRIYNVVKI